MPSVSVCIPVYNREAEVRRAVASALDQTFAELEVVVVDNASTDGTWRVAQECAARDGRVRAYRNDVNLGPVPNWRRCLELAEGRYVKLLFSDDWLSPDAILRMVAPLEARDDVGFVYSSVLGHMGEAEPQTWYRSAAEGPIPSAEFLWRSAAVDDVPVSPSAALLRRADALELLEPAIPIPSGLGFDFNGHGIGNDGLLLWRCCDRYPLVHHVREPVVHFAEPSAGEPSITMSLGRAGKVDMIWWGYRNALAYFIVNSSQPPPAKRALQTALFLSSVPFRPRPFWRALRTFRCLFPEGYQWWRLAPLDERVRALLLRRIKLRLGIMRAGWQARAASLGLAGSTSERS